MSEIERPARPVPRSLDQLAGRAPAGRDDRGGASLPARRRMGDPRGGARLGRRLADDPRCSGWSGARRWRRCVHPRWSWHSRGLRRRAGRYGVAARPPTPITRAQRRPAPVTVRVPRLRRARRHDHRPDRDHRDRRRTIRDRRIFGPLAATRTPTRCRTGRAGVGPGGRVGIRQPRPHLARSGRPTRTLISSTFTVPLDLGELPVRGGVGDTGVRDGSQIVLTAPKGAFGATVPAIDRDRPAPRRRPR